MTFLQLGAVRAHRSVLEATRLARMTQEERLLAMTTTALKPFIDNVTHGVDQAMCMISEEELGVMAYLLTQYNFKPGLRKFGTRCVKRPQEEIQLINVL